MYCSEYNAIINIFAISLKEFTLFLAFMGFVVVWVQRGELIIAINIHEFREQTVIHYIIRPGLMAHCYAIIIVKCAGDVHRLKIGESPCLSI